MIRDTIYFSGQVQGVGFRHTTQQISRRFEVGGYVRNLPDGRVEVVAEGEPEEVDRFVTDIERNMGGFIRDVDRSRTETDGEFNGFQVKM